MPVLSFLGKYGSEARNADITMNRLGFHGADRGGDGVRIEFSTPMPKDARGYVVIQPDSFERLAFAMMAINPNAAIKALGQPFMLTRPISSRLSGLGSLPRKRQRVPKVRELN
jgi:hypothetical protein